MSNNNKNWEREGDFDLLNEWEATSNGLAASEPSIDPVVEALTKKVAILEIQQRENLAKMESMERKIRQQHELLNGFICYQEHQNAMMQIESLLQQKFLVELKHKEEHENTIFVLVDNSSGARWDTSTSELCVRGSTVKCYRQGCSIRSKRGFPTAPNPGYSDQLIYNIHYFEITIEEMPNGYIWLGLVANNYSMNECVGCSNGTFGFGANDDGKLWHFGEPVANLHVDNFHCGFTKGNVLGCGLMVVAQKTANGEAAECEECKQRQCTLFFTRNGQFWGTQVPLSSNVPSMLYPAVSLFCSGNKVTANFGHEPFKFKISPAVMGI